jgi:hypothetical protein
MRHVEYARRDADGIDLAGRGRGVAARLEISGVIYPARAHTQWRAMWRTMRHITLMKKAEIAPGQFLSDQV